jgi:fructokinase
MRVPRAAGDNYAGWCRFHGDCVEGLISGPALAERFGCPGKELPRRRAAMGSVRPRSGRAAPQPRHVAAPERIAIGGGVIVAREHLFARLRARLAESLGGYGSLEPYAGSWTTRLGPPGLGAMAGPLGAIAVGLGG